MEKLLFSLDIESRNILLFESGTKFTVVLPYAALFSGKPFEGLQRKVQLTLIFILGQNNWQHYRIFRYGPWQPQIYFNFKLEGFTKIDIKEKKTNFKDWERLAEGND